MILRQKEALLIGKEKYGQRSVISAIGSHQPLHSNCHMYQTSRFNEKLTLASAQAIALRGILLAGGRRIRIRFCAAGPASDGA